MTRKLLPLAFAAVLFGSCGSSDDPNGNVDGKALAQESPTGFDAAINEHSKKLMREGREIFRFDTFGSEAFWTESLRLHEAIVTISPKKALEVGLKVDADAIPAETAAAIKAGQVDLDDPAVTLQLLKLNSVVGVQATLGEQNELRTIGITCALCHSTVDDSFRPGIGKRLDGWANRDLNVGAIISLAPNLKPFTDMLRVDEASVRSVLASWGPGKYDAHLDKDGQGLRPDGKSAATLIPPAFGLAGVNLHTWTGMGSVPYWNVYVAATQMHGSGVYYDARLKDAPVAARTGSWNVRRSPDRITPKLAALHVYQLSIPAPKPPEGSFDASAADRGGKLFAGKARCATCHVPPLFTEPGNNLHSPAEMGIDSFQADRSPTKAYRTAPLKGLWTHLKGGFYHDGRFATLADVMEHYNRQFALHLAADEKRDVIEYLKSLSD